MRRLILCRRAIAIGAALMSGAAFAQPAMRATAPEKMMPPTEKARLESCQRKAAQQNIEMNGRAKFIMDCMQATKK